MIEVTIDSLRVSLTNQQRVILLKSAVSDLYLPIWIGSFEAESIILSLQGIEVSRPQPHDLLKLVIKAFDAKLSQVEIIKIQADTYYAALALEKKDNSIIRVDCRPSDAIAMAVRAHAPIFVDEAVFAIAGITRDQDMRVKPVSAIHENGENGENGEFIAKEDLSIFENFFNSIRQDGTSSDEGDQPSSTELDSDEE